MRVEWILLIDKRMKFMKPLAPPKLSSRSILIENQENQRRLGPQANTQFIIWVPNLWRLENRVFMLVATRF